jgi:hypothetical protein
MTDTTADRLNRECLGDTLDGAALQRELDRDGDGLYGMCAGERPNLFSATAVFVDTPVAARMQTVIRAVEDTVALPAFRERVMAWAPHSARVGFGPRGAFMGYDFHLTAGGPQLIEVNTNAGGALLSAALARAQVAGCADMAPHLPPPAAHAGLDDAWVEMFRAEWRHQHGGRPLEVVAIVDDAPASQYLYPEFLLTQRLLRRHGIETLVADAADLMACHGGLWHEDTKIDLVYNRLTDFALDEPRHAPLRATYLDGGVVLTPHPHAHALYADKRNLVALTDEALLRTCGVPAETIATLLAGIPRTERVTAGVAPSLWARRDGLFFKPAAGFGARAAYRGDKITRRVWEEVVAGDYVAQQFAPPAERMVMHAGAPTAYKYDIRNYVYDGTVQMMTARLYRGQTTNFRTPRGGFAPVLTVP